MKYFICEGNTECTARQVDKNNDQIFRSLVKATRTKLQKKYPNNKYLMFVNKFMTFFHVAHCGIVYNTDTDHPTFMLKTDRMRFSCE